ncbi:MAG TPA: hypothetical protein VI542_01480 [Candidatus Tectomicrobia bacterium]
MITNVEFAKNMPKDQVLSYLVRTPSDSSAVNLYETLAGQTVDLNGLNKASANGVHQPKHIISLKTAPRQSAFISLQKWEGVVVEVLSDSFLTRLVDLTRTGPDEEAGFPVDEVSEEDRPLIRPGAIFYWNIGYHNSYSGQRTRTSIIRFRRLPAWTREEIEAAKREAERLGKSIGWK